ncbi:flagellar basal body-associated FliL family protein [Porticoccaceae bacterium]|nr:flagellar basal body-associated FliL family protein [Porticoccaceae bacterium]MDA8652370.1 flagellar basal body-associated FliL family protein [Porticoccaceae bacterium]MDA8663479.1 flagellar basal body-associated FliL family protein [Porticoccaceae bacterium]MDA8788835.1 flagellar basal body-associated FliL family protein [Porticoccaceae bacterium]MDB2343165.1 flagellar basal body-associated FliL family protein [Porticoccaceae bacterium]
MNDEEDQTTEGKPVGKMILIAVIILTVLGGASGGALYAMGHFDAPPDAEIVISEMENPSRPAAKEKKKKKPSRNTDAELSYFEIKSKLLSNLYNSNRMIQVKVAVMVEEEDEGAKIEEVKKHAFPVRSSLLKVLSSKREDQIAGHDFRDQLENDLKIAMNDVLQERTGKRHVEELYLTEFIVQ